MKVEQFLNLYQRHHFFIAPLVVVLVLGFFFDLKPVLNEWSKLQMEKNNLSQQLKDKEQALRQAALLSQQLQVPSTVKNKKPLFNHLIQLANQNFCELDSFQAEPQNKENASNAVQGLRIKMQLRGDFLHFYHFLAALLHQGLPLQVDHFILQTEGENISMSIQFMAFPALGQGISQSTLACCRRDPFRDLRMRREENAAITDGVSQQFTPDELRYVGFFSEAGKTAALVMLPDGQSYDIYSGSRLGKGPWRVLKINATYLTFFDEEKKTVRRIVRVRA